MKSKFTSVFFVLMSAGTFALQSCEKTGIINDARVKSVDSSFATGLSSKSVTGGGGTGGGGISGGGTSGGGHNGGGGGTVTPASPALAPTDTTTSDLPVADIITTGRWELTAFVQGNDNFASQFASDIFTFNADGSMIADDNGSQTTGLWHYQDAVFYYGIPVYGSSPYGFTMSIGTTTPLTNLDKNYFISKKTLTTIYIDSINPTENAHMTFSKLAQ